MPSPTSLKPSSPSNSSLWKDLTQLNKQLDLLLIGLHLTQRTMKMNHLQFIRKFCLMPQGRTKNLWWLSTVIHWWNSIHMCGKSWSTKDQVKFQIMEIRLLFAYHVNLSKDVVSSLDARAWPHRDQPARSFTCQPEEAAETLVPLDLTQLFFGPYLL